MLTEPLISFEFFPPRDGQKIKDLVADAELLRTFYPEFFPATFGVDGGGTTLTADTAVALHEGIGVEVVPHISCVNLSTDQARSVLNTYQEVGMQRLVVLRGDKPSWIPVANDFPYASDLVQFVRNEYQSSFPLDVAAYPEAHPEATSAGIDMLNFRKKVESGADRTITQYFFNCDAYFRFVDGCARYGVDIPIIPGLLPITSVVGLKRFSDLCGVEIPRWISKRIEEYCDDIRSLQDFGMDVVSRMGSRLLEGGAPGLYFFTLNRVDSVYRICANLNLAR